MAGGQQYDAIVIGSGQGGNPLAGPATKPFEVPRLELPDFAQPPEDDKYFRQMKRF